VFAWSTPVQRVNAAIVAMTEIGAASSPDSISKSSLTIFELLDNDGLLALLEDIRDLGRRYALVRDISGIELLERGLYAVALRHSPHCQSTPPNADGSPCVGRQAAILLDRLQHIKPLLR